MKKSIIITILFLLFFASVLFATNAEDETAIINFEAMSNCKMTVVPPEPWFSDHWDFGDSGTANMRGYDYAIRVTGEMRNTVVEVKFKEDGVPPPPKGYFYLKFKCGKFYIDNWFMYPIGDPRY